MLPPFTNEAHVCVDMTMSSRRLEIVVEYSTCLQDFAMDFGVSM